MKITPNTGLICVYRFFEGRCNRSNRIWSGAKIELKRACYEASQIVSPPFKQSKVWKSSQTQVLYMSFGFLKAVAIECPCQLLYSVHDRRNPSMGSWPPLTPPVDLVKFFWLKMPSKCVPWIVLQVSTSTHTYKGPELALKCRRAEIPPSDPDYYWTPLPTRSNFFGSKCLLNVSHG